MNKRLQTILETVENLMEYRVPSDQDRNKRHERLRQMPGSRVSSPSTQPLGSIEPNPNYSPRGDKIDPHYVSRTVYDSQQVIRRPPPKKNTPSTYGQRPSTEAPTGLLGAGSSVSGYDSRPKTGGLLGAGSSVSGYDSGSDAPTPQPPSNKPPYPRLPPSVRPGAGDGFDKVPYNPNRPGFKPYRPEPTPDIGPYKPFPKIPSTPKRPGIGIEPRWPRIRIEQEISDAERRRSEQFIRAEDRPAKPFPNNSLSR